MAGTNFGGTNAMMNPFGMQQQAQSPQGYGQPNYGQQGAQAPNSNPLLQFMGSNGGSSLISGILGGLGQMGAAKANERMSNAQLANQNLGLLSNAYGNNQQDAFNRDALLAQQAPTGWAQNYEQQTEMKNLILQKLLAGSASSSFQPTNAAVAAKLQAQPQFTPTIPDEWKNVNPFGVDQTMQSLAQRQGTLDLLSGGRGPGMDFSQMGLDPTKAAALNKSTGDYRAYAGQQYAQPQQQLINAINGGRLGTNPAGNSGGGPRGNGMGGAIASTAMSAAMPSVLGKLGMGGMGGMAGGLGAGLATGAATAGIGLAVPAVMGLYNHMQQGAHTNDARDQFKSQFGDSQGSGLQNMIDQYSGPNRDQLMNAYNQFMTAGKPQNLNNAITGLSQYLSPQQGMMQPQQMRNPYANY